MNTQEVINLLEDFLDGLEYLRHANPDDLRALQQRISAEASVDVIVSAIREARAPLTRQALFDIAGMRRVWEALPELLAGLDDAVPLVRCAAAAALIAFPGPTTGSALLDHYRWERDPEVRVNLAIVLGEVRYRPAIPDLILALDDPTLGLDVQAALSLGDLHATEAREPMARLLSRVGPRTYPFVKDALAKLDSRAMDCRPGAVANLEMVNVCEEALTAPTRLVVKAWVGNVAYEKKVWMDLDHLGEAGAPLHSETLFLRYLEPGVGHGDLFLADVPLRPAPWTARELRYRLYYEVDGRVFTDGICHQHRL